MNDFGSHGTVDSASCETGALSRPAAIRLLVASLAIAFSILFAAWLDAPWRGTAAIVSAGIFGGVLLRRHARVQGLPLLCATVMAAGVLVAAALGDVEGFIVGGPVFMAVLISTTAATRASGLSATGILAAAVILVALF